MTSSSPRLGYIDWFNHRRLHGEITDDNSYVTPAEFEATYYRQSAPASRRLPKQASSHETRAVHGDEPVDEDDALDDTAI